MAIYSSLESESITYNVPLMSALTDPFSRRKHRKHDSDVCDQVSSIGTSRTISSHRATMYTVTRTTYPALQRLLLD